MSEKEKEKEKEKQEVILDHFCHKHPLSLTECSQSEPCYGCRRNVYSGEMVYRCHKECGSSLTFHEECAEMPREIRLLMHPQHTLIQKVALHFPYCAVCKSRIVRIGYYCTSSDSCDFQIHVGCTLNMGVLKTCIDHPSHPQHQLTLLRRSGRSCLSRCDACSTIHRGSSYICTDCQYSIKESCAALPDTEHYHHLHNDHALSLAFRVPLEYLKFNIPCHICFKEFIPKYWVYHCRICRYVVHINCAINTSPATSNIDTNNAGDDKDVIAFPVNNAGEELIGPYVIKAGGAKTIFPGDNEIIVNSKYKFHNHDHELRVIPSSLQLHDDEEKKEEEEENSDDDDDLNLVKKSELVCDGCTTPIFQDKYYMSCGECKYFLHWACFHLPPELSSHPLHRQYHNLILQTLPILGYETLCYVCGFDMNGLYYRCTTCSFTADIKCISLPDTIKHAAHRQHHLKLLDEEITRESSYRQRLCSACRDHTHYAVCYKCDN